MRWPRRFAGFGVAREDAAVNDPQEAIDQETGHFGPRVRVVEWAAQSEIFEAHVRMRRVEFFELLERFFLVAVVHVPMY